MRELLFCGWFLLASLLGVSPAPCPSQASCDAREAALAGLGCRAGLVARRQAETCAERCGKTVTGRVAALERLRRELSRLQTELFALLDKPPYSDNVKTTVRNIDLLFNALNAEFSQTLAGVERDTLLLSAFGVGTGLQEGRAGTRLAGLRSAGEELASGAKRVAELISAMEKEPVRLGDLNGDGVITAQDLLLLVKPLGRKAAVAANADLDGNGRIDSSDFRFLQQAVYGHRTRFPADAALQPGDLNGDGLLDWMDLFDLAGVVRKNRRNPPPITSPWDGQYDINADGRVDEADFQMLVRSIAAQLPAGESAQPETASGPVAR
ncbi:MAG TPA: dockerin type I domain-containing protein [Candidatus Ozemobacteraceae bacterium]|nr:dockerin type I domain-containing protein [Candidatus Ozemobacteraceae bacterium]